MSKDRIFKEIGFECSPLGVPNSKGVYAVCVFNEDEYPAKFRSARVVYIGSSLKMRGRLQNSTHPYRRCFSILKNYSVGCFYLECDNHLEVEMDLIIKYKPRFNTVHNGK